MSYNIITLNRGDSYPFTLYIDDPNSQDGIYRLKDDDTVYLGIMDPHQLFENALVRKKYTADDMDEAGNISIVIKPEDTIDLYPGIYYYAVKLHKLSPANQETGDSEIDEVLTVINKTKFIIND
jgi:hypothetical protein